MYYPLIVLKDGSIIQITQYSSCERESSDVKYNDDGTIMKDADGNPIIGIWIDHYCAAIKFDTNGTAKPNQFGADAFLLRVFKNGYMDGVNSYGWKSLRAILSGNEPEYTKYTSGSKKE